MFWIGTGSLIILFFGIKSFLNNKSQWKSRGPKNSTRLYFLLLQGSTLLLILSAVLFFMLAVVCHFQGFQIHFSSDFQYHMQIATEPA